MTTTIEQPFTIDKLGINHRDFFTIAILKLLSDRPHYGLELFQVLEDGLEGKRISLSNFYATLKKLEKEYGLISQNKGDDNRTKVYAITEEGKQKLDWYHDSFYEPFKQVKHLADVFYYEITKMGYKPKVYEVQKEYQRFFGKLVYVRRLVEYIVLKHLLQNPSLAPYEILDNCKDLFGWQPNKRYFYGVIWDMDDKLWIQGQWKDEKRSNRLYQLEAKGRDVFRQIEDEVLHSVSVVQRFMDSVLPWLNN
jgi:DNA-binding PadR family transcriptional regulator